MVRICCATTDNTSKSMRLNSSKQDQAPQEANPLKERINHKERGSTSTFPPCLHKVTSKLLQNVCLFGKNSDPCVSLAWLRDKCLPVLFTWAVKTTNYNVLNLKTNTIAVVRVEPADTSSFVYSCMQTIPVAQYNGKWPTSLVSKRWQLTTADNWQPLWKVPCYLEEFSKRNVVQAIWAVEHHTLFSNSFGQILCCFCLACPSWTLWGTSQVQLKSSKKSPTKERNHQYRSHDRSTCSHTQSYLC